MLGPITTILFLLTLLSLTTATRIWTNPGTIKGWDNVYIDANTDGTVTEVSNVVFGSSGGTAIKSTQTYLDRTDVRYHAEVHHNDGYTLGQTRSYGFAFRLAAAWESSPAQSYNIAQFIRPFSQCGDNSRPSTMVWLIGDQLAARVKNADLCGTGGILNGTNLAQVTPGVWHKVVMEASWRADSSGYFRLYFDGTLVWSKTGVATTFEVPETYGFHMGIYANGWHDDKGMKGTQRFRQIWYDQIAIGTTKEEVDPSAWAA